MDIKLHKNDLPKDLEFGNKIAVDCEFMGLNFMRDKLCVVQISSGNSLPTKGLAFISLKNSHKKEGIDLAKQLLK